MTVPNNELDGLLYPDVLGRITSQYIQAGNLQYAVGITPKEGRLNQATWVIVLLQSMVSQSIMVRVNVRPPDETAEGQPVTFYMEKKLFPLGLRPGEVGVLRVPLMPADPTPPNKDYPVQVAVRSRLPPPPNRHIRPAYGGVRPAVLNISPYKLNALSDDVSYEAVSWYQSRETVTVHFNLVKKRLPPLGGEPSAHYETLWSGDEMQEERQLVAKVVPWLKNQVDQLQQADLYAALSSQLPRLMQKRGMSLYLGEAQLVTCLMLESLFGEWEATRHTHWFAALAQWIAHYPHLKMTPMPDLIAEKVMEPLLVDTVALASQYAGANTNAHPPDTTSLLLTPSQTNPLPLEDLYNPLIIGALQHPLRYCPTECSAIVEALRAAYAKRRRLASASGLAMLQTAEKLLTQR